MDEDFFTWHDHTFSTIMAFEMLSDYIIVELKKLDNLEKGIVEFPESTLFWTGKKIELGLLVGLLFMFTSLHIAASMTVDDQFYSAKPAQVLAFLLGRILLPVILVYFAWHTVRIFTKQKNPPHC